MNKYCLLFLGEVYTRERRNLSERGKCTIKKQMKVDYSVDRYKIR